jgi:hypothetical protein
MRCRAVSRGSTVGAATPATMPTRRREADISAINQETCDFHLSPATDGPFHMGTTLFHAARRSSCSVRSKCRSLRVRSSRLSRQFAGRTDVSCQSADVTQAPRGGTMKAGKPVELTDRLFSRDRWLAELLPRRNVFLETT